MKFFPFLIVCASLIACGPSTSTVELNWDANPEFAVNSPGGGYTVYYSDKSEFDISDPKVKTIDVPYESGSETPNFVQLELEEGNYVFKIAAYSSLSTRTTVGSRSEISDEVSLIVTAN